MLRKLLASIVVIFALSASAAMAQPKRVAIAGWGPHPSLDGAIAGFKRGLAQEGFAEGAGVVFDEANVNFDAALLPQMLTRLAGAKPDLMVTIATPASLAARQQLRSRSFPIVYTPIADPVVAGLATSWDAGEKLMTGSSVALDYKAVLTFTATLLPDLKRLGVVYDTGDESSKVALESLEKEAGNAGLSIVRIGVDNPNELPQRVQAGVGRVDAFFPVASGRIQQGIAAIASTAERAKLPVVTTIPPAVQAHQALASYGVSFERSGEAAGRIAGRILKGADPQTIPPWRPMPDQHQPLISARKMQQLGLKLPTALSGCGCLVE